MNSQPFALIDLKNLINNAEILKAACAPAKFCAVVKADGYGHGCAEIAAAIDGIADLFAVGNVSEGVKLRFAGVTSPIVCLIPQGEREYDRAGRYGVQVTLSSISQIEKFCEYAKIHDAPSFQLAINSGMNRLGLDEAEFKSAILKLYSAGATGKNGLFCGIFSHFYNVCDYSSCEKQYYDFLRAADLFSGLGSNFAHIASSGALIYYGSRFRMKAVRAGLALYGYMPDKTIKGCGRNADINRDFYGLKPVMSVYASVFNRRRLAAGEHLLYGEETVSSPVEADIAGYGYFYGFKSGTGIKPACMNICAVEHKSSDNDYKRKLKALSGSCGECPDDCVCIFDNAETIAENAGVSVYEVLTAAENIKKYYMK